MDPYTKRENMRRMLALLREKRNLGNSHTLHGFRKGKKFFRSSAFFSPYSHSYVLPNFVLPIFLVFFLVFYFWYIFAYFFIKIPRWINVCLCISLVSFRAFIFALTFLVHRESVHSSSIFHSPYYNNLVKFALNAFIFPLCVILFARGECFKSSFRTETLLYGYVLRA